MEHSFWHDKWERMEIGFHLDEVNKMLLKYWPAAEIAKGQLVLVPLCGKSLDIIWLMNQGYYVVGIELSEVALDQLSEDIREQTGTELTKTRDGDRILYQGDGVLLIAGDFFAVSAADLQALTGHSVAAVYDRAAIVALPAEMRQQYTRHLRQLSGDCVQLLITLDYDQQKRSGPPFAVTDQEVMDHYAAHCPVTVLESRELIDQEPRFREQGLDSFILRVYRIG